MSVVAQLRTRPDGEVRGPFKVYHVGLIVLVACVVHARFQIRERRNWRQQQLELELALCAWRTSQLTRQARRRLERTRRRYRWAEGAYASIASPIGMGNDGQKAYDLATRTWFGTVLGILQAVGQPWYDVTAPVYAGGAKGNGVTDDTNAGSAAITAANVNGGIVWHPIGQYPYTSALTPLASAVWLMGAVAMVGLIFGDTLKGSVIKVGAGAYDLVTSAATAKGVGVVNLAFDGQTDNAHWVIKMLGVSGGLVLHNLGLRQYATGANGILLDGGASGIFDAKIDTVAAFCGGGFTGGTGFRMGLTSDCNANTSVNLTLVGYTTGLNNDRGGGNTYVGTWLQSCITGARLNSSLCLMSGGWGESLTTWFVFTAASVNNVVFAPRRSGSVTTLYTDAGTGNRLIAMDGTDYGDVQYANALFLKWLGTDAAVRGHLRLDGSNLVRLAGIGTLPTGSVALATSDTAGTVVDRVQVLGSGVGAGAGLQAHAQVYPGQPTIGFQTAAGLLGGTGAPNNANGNNGDKYFRSDSGAGTTIYDKRAGAWVGVV